jgi:hypothetical protein
MFSRDNRHYRATPRTITQAFGPYHRYDIAVCKKHERLCAVVGVVIVGIVFGLLIGWRG